MSSYGGWGGGRATAGVPLYSEIQCIIGNGHMGPPGEQIDMTENIAFQQLCWQG